MSTHSIGTIDFAITPVSIMKCWIGVGWSARGSDEERREFRVFTGDLFPFLFRCEDTTEIATFSSDVVGEIDRIISTNFLKTPFISRFGTRLKSRFDRENQLRAAQFAEKYACMVEEWIATPVGLCAPKAVSLLSECGLPLTQKGLGAVGSFGNAVLGKYVPNLQAVCVQLDAVANSNTPDVEFLDTLLHEEIHAAIHVAMGDDEGRPELSWLDELCAVRSSHHAMKVAIEERLDGPTRTQAIQDLERVRAKQSHGHLADAVLRETSNPLIALQAWKRIFTLPAEDKKNYARNRVITPILRELGWAVNFPFKYENRSVTVFV
jgi:hypothetical protein